MTLKDKLSCECPTQIHLYLEGIFWKLYNHSAFHFSKLIKPYQVKKKYSKTLNIEIVNMGFPQSILPKTLERLREIAVSVDIGEREISVTLAEGQNGYDEWFQQFPLVENVKTLAPDSLVSSFCLQSNKANERVLQALRDFPIMQKTPLDVQLFVLQLQDSLKQGGI